jgi:CheY-like chemotaxis protein/HPt (histidine-containing phosphotransfer) domain-containing protein
MQTATASPPLSQQPLVGLSALIVNDNAINRHVLADYLQGWGMVVTLAEHAEQALSILAAATDKPCDFVLLDLQHSDYDGWQLAATIRQNPTLDATFCVIMPNHGKRGDSQRCHELRINGYLIKPIIYAELYEMLCAIPGAGEHGAAVGPVTRHTVLENRNRLSILVADDVIINQELIMAILTRCGHTVTVANNGEEAVSIWHQNSAAFDIIFMDIQMPVMDGLQATRTIREREHGSGKHIPIVALTAYAMKGDIDRCLDAGMDDYISKPFKSEQVQQALQRLCAENRHAQQHVDICGNDHEPQADIPEMMTFNEPLLVERLGGEEELVPKFIAMFHKGMAENLLKIAEALASANYEAMKAIAHAMKGSAANIAAEKLSAIAAEMELGSRNEDLAKVRDLQDELQAEYDRFKSVTEQYG